jgi:hypothetical protein
MSKDKDLAIFSGNKEIGNMTVNELQATADKVEINGNKIKLQKKEGSIIAKMEITSYPTGQQKTISINDTSDKEKVRETVEIRLANKDLQKDIAFDLGMTQGNVSKIKNRKSKQK